MSWFHLCCVFFFKQKTAYEMRISDWSSDVCSSDLLVQQGLVLAERQPFGRGAFPGTRDDRLAPLGRVQEDMSLAQPRAIVREVPDRERVGRKEIGRASWRERGCQYV